jgi:hypothetical protein
LRAALTFVLLLSACDTEGGPTPDLGAATDGSDDASGYVPSHDAGPLVCAAAGVCQSPAGCCVNTLPDGGADPTCATSCPNGVPVQCSGPGHCDGLPCCLTLMNARPQNVSCSAQQTDCVPNINFMGTGVTRGCDTDDDCTAGAPDTNFNQCCHLVTLGYRLCFAKGFVPVTKGQIACP